MLSKDNIRNALQTGNGAVNALLRSKDDSNHIRFVLENLGFLPDDFDGSVVRQFLQHRQANIRLLAIKNLGKLKTLAYLEDLSCAAFTDANTNVRREAVSAIGRMRSKRAWDVLMRALEDEDPKIVCQAIRGLLVFKGEKKIDDALQSLSRHENETVRQIIAREYQPASVTRTAPFQPHTAVNDCLKNVIVCGDTIEVMRCLSAESIHLTFTSPPYYNARDYSIYPSYEKYLSFLEEVFREVYRITKEGRFFVLNTSPVIVPRVSRAHSSKRYPIPFDIHPRLIKMGWDFVDDIVWQKPESSVKNRVGGFMQHRKPLGYKPNPVTEYLMVYRKTTTRLLDWNMRQYDRKTVEESKVKGDYETTNVWQIDPCFNKVHSAVFPKDLCKRVIQYYSYQGDVVFDPFAGSGTVGRVAKNLKRHFFLTEKDKTYFSYMQSQKREPLLDNTPTRFLSLKKFAETVSCQ